MIRGEIVRRRTAGLFAAGIALLVAAPALGACPASPTGGCKVSMAAKFSIRDLTDDSKDQLSWKWAKGEGLVRVNFGDPLNGTTYTLCVYAGTAQALVGEAPLPAGAGWKDSSSGGYGFSAVNSDGIRFASLKAGEAGKSSAAIKGRGVALPDLPMPLVAPVTVQLLADPEPLCLQTQFADTDLEVNTDTRLKGQAQGTLPIMARVIPADDLCNRAGDDGAVADQVGAQMRRSGTEWASSCLGYYGAAGTTCEVDFSGDNSYLTVPDGVPSLVCPNLADCDSSLGRVEWHAEDKFSRKCTFPQWELVWEWIQQRAGAVAPPDCDARAFAPGFWGVYACYEQYYVHPVMVDMLAKLRGYTSPNPPMMPACEGALVNRLWWRLASDWIRFGNDDCRDVFDDTAVQAACGTHTAAPKIDQATLNAWCDDFTAALRPVYEGVRAASGKPY